MKDTMKTTGKAVLMAGGVIFWPLFLYGFFKELISPSDK